MQKLGLGAALLALAALALVGGKAGTAPPGLPAELPVRRVTEVPDPVQVAQWWRKKLAPDSGLYPGYGGGYDLAPGGAHLAFIFTSGPVIAGGYPTIFLQRSDGSGPRFFDHPTLWRPVQQDYPPVHYHSVRWSHNGRRLFFASPGPYRLEGVPAIWSCALDGSGLRCHTPRSLPASLPAPAPDGRRITFVAGRAVTVERGTQDLYLADLSGRYRRCLAAGGVAGGGEWAPDGRRIVYRRSGEAPDDERLEIVTPDGRFRRTLVSLARLRAARPDVPSISLDGYRWLADSATLLLTVRGPLRRLRPDRAEHVATYHLWRVRRDGALISLGEGQALAATNDGRWLLLQRGGKVLLAETTP